MTGRITRTIRGWLARMAGLFCNEANPSSKRPGQRAGHHSALPGPADGAPLPITVLAAVVRDLLRVRLEFAVTEPRLEDDAALRAAAPDGVIRRAAPAGVGWSIETPRADVETDIGATFIMMKATRQVGPITCGWPRPVRTIAPARRCPSVPPPLT